MRREDAPQPNREELTALICRSTHFTSAVEPVPLRNCLGRVLAEDVFSLTELPNRPVSRMDGITYRFRDYLAAGGDCHNWREGVDYVFSNTGVAIPAEFDTVTLIEDTEFAANGALRITRPPLQQGENVSPAGSRICMGQKLTDRYRVLTAGDLGALAAGGVMEPVVFKKPLVAFIPTGDELIPPGSPPQPGKNVESNSVTIGALIEQWGGKPELFPIVPDQPDLLIGALQQALSYCDIFVLNAGSSKGRKDFAGDVLNAVGDVLVYESGCGPGKHASFALSDTGKPILGLAGPPGGAEMTAGWYLAPLICQYLHKPFIPPEKVEAILTAEAKAHVPFQFFLPVTVRREVDGIYSASPRPLLGRPVAPDAAAPNGVLPIPGGRIFAKGERVWVELAMPKEYLP